MMGGGIEMGYLVGGHVIKVVYSLKNLIQKNIPKKIFKNM
jgi:hypothetical protein